MKEIATLRGEFKTFKRNEFIKTQGSLDTNVYFIESGSVRVFILDDEEKEQNIRLGYKNNIITALDAFLTGNASKLNIQAIKKTSIKVIPKLEIDKFLQEEGNKMFWIKILEDLIVQQMEREEDLLTNSPKERYLRVLKRSPQLFQEIPNRHIANYLRMSSETLSRLKKS